MTQEKDFSKINYAVLQRLRFIEIMLAECGRFNRGALVRYFGISVPQASADLQQYLELAPDNASYDTTLRAYVASKDFVSIFP